MRGRQVFFETLLAHGVDRIFGNPGTTESPLLDSLLDYPQLQYIVHLHEGVAVGAANFYAQASGKTAFVNLHVAPGLGNGIGMIYSALKNNSPMVVTAGQQDTRIRLRDPVLGHDLGGDGRAGHQVERAGRERRRARAHPAARLQDRQRCAGRPGVRGAAHQRHGAGDHGGAQARAGLHREPSRSRRHRGDVAADHRRQESGDRGRRRRGPHRCGQDAGEAGRAHRRLGVVRGLRGRNSFSTDHPAYRGTLAFDAPGIAKQFAENDLVLLVGGPFFEEVWYGPGSPFPPGCKVLQIEAAPPRMAYNFAVDAGVIADVDAALEALWQATTGINGAAARARQDAFRAQKQADDAAQKARVEKAWSRTPTSMARVMAELKAASPANVVVVDETITANLDLFKTFTFSDAGDYYSGRGGGIGQAWPARSAWRWPSPAGRSSASRATARRCTPSRRCGRRRTTTCRSCS